MQPWLLSMGCGLFLWLLAAAGPRPPRLQLALPAAGVVLWAAVSHGSVRPDSLFLGAGLLLIAIAAAVAAGPHMNKGLQTGLVMAAAVSALIGLVQYFGWSEAFSPWVNRTAAGESYANLRQPNQYATLAWIGVAVLLWGRLPLRFGVATALMGLLAVASAASLSRTGMLQGALLTVLAACWGGPDRRRRMLQCAAAGLAYFAATWLLPVILEAVTGSLPARTLWGRVGASDGCASRLVLWSNVLHLIAQKPFAGWGWGELDYAHFTTLYEGPRFCDILDNAHNLPLHLAVELGVPAATVLCAAFAAWILGRQPWREAASERRLGWAILGLVLLHSLLEYPLWYGPFQLAFGVALGWLNAPGGRHAPPPVRLRAVLVGAALVVATGYAAWDYARVSQIYLPPEQRLAAWRDETLAHARRSWLFGAQARFAELTLSNVTSANAAQLRGLAHDALHYSPEPRVIERAITSAALLGRDEEAMELLARYAAAFPAESKAWRERGRAPRGND